MNSVTLLHSGNLKVGLKTPIELQSKVLEIDFLKLSRDKFSLTLQTSKFCLFSLHSSM